MIDGGDYKARVNIEVTTVVSFEHMEREGPILPSDVVENAIGMLFLDELAEHFESIGFTFRIAGGDMIERVG